MELVVRPVIGTQEMCQTACLLKHTYESAIKGECAASEANSIARAVGLVLGECGGLDLMALVYDMVQRRGGDSAAQWLSNVWLGHQVSDGAQWVRRDVIELDPFGPN